MLWSIPTDWENHALLATSQAAGINGFYCLQFFIIKSFPRLHSGERNSRKAHSMGNLLHYWRWGLNRNLCTQYCIILLAGKLLFPEETTSNLLREREKKTTLNPITDVFSVIFIHKFGDEKDEANKKWNLVLQCWRVTNKPSWENQHEVWSS